ncbi:MAG: PadR family transcriptional regulator [Gemmatimonadota bacterium]|nr:PadR family transcriptional regulator [Gemmatimonadota bacterium]
MTRSDWDCFGFPFGFAAGMRTGRGKRRRWQWFESGDMKYVILKLLREKPMHGYEVMKALEEHTCGCYKPSPGTVYPTLQWLEDEGLVGAKEVEGKKVYEITDEGRAFLDKHRTVVDDIFDRITETLDRVTADPIPEVSRAVGRLVSQAYKTTWHLAADRARANRVAEILDKAADEIAALHVADTGSAEPEGD